MGLNLNPSEQIPKVVEASVGAVRLGWQAGSYVMKRAVIDPAFAAANFVGEFAASQQEYAERQRREEPVRKVIAAISPLYEARTNGNGEDNGNDQELDAKQQASLLYLASLAVEEAKRTQGLPEDKRTHLAALVLNAKDEASPEVDEILPEGTMDRVAELAGLPPDLTREDSSPHLEV